MPDGGAAVLRLQPDVGNLNSLFRRRYAPERSPRICTQYRFTSPCLRKGSRRAIECSSAKRASLRQKQRAALGLATPRRVRQHGLEYRLQLARRARDDAEHLGGSGLLLECFAEFARA